jgi:transposase
VVLLPPSQVRPFVRGNRTDRSDAKARVEAYRCGEIRPVPVKTPEQQVPTSLHRLREGWMAQRTARLNALRGLFREQGVFLYYDVLPGRFDQQTKTITGAPSLEETVSHVPGRSVSDVPGCSL